MASSSDVSLFLELSIQMSLDDSHTLDTFEEVTILVVVLVPMYTTTSVYANFIFICEDKITLFLSVRIKMLFSIDS